MANWHTRIAAFDLETTGLDLSEARIVTACVVELGTDGTPISNPREWLVNPGVSIPEVATSVHGITNEVAQREGMPPIRAIAEIVSALSDLQQRKVPVAIFNAPYDLTILRAECARYSLPALDARLIVDPLVLDRKFVPFRRGKRTLTVLADAYGVPLENAHDSTADAIAAGQLAQLQIATHVGPETTAEDLQEMQSIWSDEQTASLEQFIRKSNPAFAASYGWPLKAS
ncbi:MAG: hypothetical protein RL198_366 [Actinomycetota bacterium]